MKPTIKPNNPNFSSGPCSKRPGYSLDQLQIDTLGRSHRSSIGKKALGLACTETAKILGLPEGYRVGVVPASDTGAVEMIMWSVLGQRPVDIFAWESFGRGWLTDAVKQLKLDNLNSYTADYGALPDMSQANPDNDCIFTWNGTTSGVKVPNADWISDDRTGLTICDATSAVFAMDMPWEKLDVVTFSFQKALGGEGGHGVLILSPRAVERLETYAPKWPIPKLFRLTAKGKLNEGIFGSATINTPSMLAVEDAIDALNWAKSIGGLPELIARSEASLEVVKAWVEITPFFSFLAEEPATVSNTSITLSITDPWFMGLHDTEKAMIASKVTKLLANEGIAFDAASYRDAPPGIRIWAGPTVETSDIAALLPWLDWAYAEVAQ